MIFKKSRKLYLAKFGFELENKMWIKKIKINNFRNYKNEEINLSKGINIFYGDNAQGKTNIIEAIFLGGFGKSFRTAKDKEMIMIGSQESEIELNYEKIDRSGKMITKYDKMHLYSYLGDTENLNSTRGTKPVIAQTDVAKIGLTICYDIRFPEIYRSYAYGGADILVNVAAWPLSRKTHWETLSRARAIENQSYMIAVSKTGEIQNGIYNLGHSVVLSPLGETIAALDYEEAVLKAEIDLEKMTQLRQNVKTLSDKHEKYDLEVK